MKEFITHPTLGKITVSQSRRARRISLAVKPTGEIRLSFPVRVPLATALEFLNSKEAWLRKALDKYSQQRAEELIAMPYATCRHHLELNPCDCDKISVRIRSGRIVVSYPLELQYTEPEVQQAIKKGIEEAWRAEAKELLPQRTVEIARQLGFKVGRVSVRNTVSRWGSCSLHNDISLSLHLMRLPDHLIDYIIAHELCHTVHKNHSPKFHALLDTCTGGRHKALNRELKAYHTRWR